MRSIYQESLSVQSNVPPLLIVDIRVRAVVTNVMELDSTRSVTRSVTDLWCVAIPARRNVDCHVTVQRSVAQDVVTATVSWSVQNLVLLVRNLVSEDVLIRSVTFSAVNRAWRILAMNHVTRFFHVAMVVLDSVVILVQLSVEDVTGTLQRHLKYFLEKSKERTPGLFSSWTAVTVFTLSPWITGQR